MSTLANADSGTLRTLSQQMRDFLKQFQEIDQDMDAALKQAGSVWRDPQYHKFIGIYHSKIDDVKNNMIQQLGKYITFLDDLAERVEVYDSDEQ